MIRLASRKGMDLCLRYPALRIAARLFDRSAETKTFKRGMDALNNPSFYRQLGRDPDRLLDVALRTLAQKFNLADYRA
jgi:hypothetical protein